MVLLNSVLVLVKLIGQNLTGYYIETSWLYAINGRYANFTINLIDVIQERKLLRRMNTRNVFDFDYNPKESDNLFTSTRFGGLYRTCYKWKWKNRPLECILKINMI